MKSRKIICFLILVSAAISAYGNIHIINTGRLPNNEAFNINMASLVEISQYADHWSPEWNYPVNKSGLIIFLKEFNNDIARINNNNDYELNLLKVVIMTYLYNLDETDYYNEINSTVEKMKRDFPNEYRTYWLSGNFLISAAIPLGGYTEFKNVLEKFNSNLGSYPVEFLDDFAYACIINQMFKTSMELYELSAARRGVSVSSNSLYRSIESSFSRPLPNTNYTDNQVWEIFSSNNEYYLRSRILGSLLPLTPTWDIRTTGIENKKCFCLIIPDRLLSRQNRLIGISVLIEFDLSNASYSQYMAEKRSEYPVTEQRELRIGNQIYNVFIFEDKSSYQNMGGAKGMFITTNTQYRENRNIGIELPVEFSFSNSEGNVSYYTMANYFHRINQNINIGILVDSSNEIFDEAYAFIRNLLERTVFE